jgi:hypothetical protein
MALALRASQAFLLRPLRQFRRERLLYSQRRRQRSLRLLRPPRRAKP